MAAIGEKEWYFYVPRDRKYRNGDRPNRVTTSGYWKATGADRMIQDENSRSIGLKKTLVFYSGKAPKGIRTSWIMNEYRLPQHETERLQKTEISLCRVYKRPGVEDHHPSLPQSLPKRRASSSRGPDKVQQQEESFSTHVMERYQAACVEQQSQPLQGAAADEKMSETSGSGSTDDRRYHHIGSALGFSKHYSYNMSLAGGPYNIPLPVEDDRMLLLPQPNCTTATNFFTGSTSLMQPTSVDDLQRLLNYHQELMNHQQQYHNYPHHFLSHLTDLQPQQSPSSNSTTLPAFPYNICDWNSIPETSKDFGSGPLK